MSSVVSERCYVPDQISNGHDLGWDGARPRIVVPHPPRAPRRPPPGATRQSSGPAPCAAVSRGHGSSCTAEPLGGSLRRVSGIIAFGAGSTQPPRGAGMPKSPSGQLPAFEPGAHPAIPDPTRLAGKG